MKVRIDENKIIEARSFNPAEFFDDRGWSFHPWYKKSSISVMDLTKVRLVSVLHECYGETYITTGKKKITFLGADAFLFFWENRQFIPDEWGRCGGVHFEGDILFGYEDSPFVLILYYSFDYQEWRWNVCWPSGGSSSSVAVIVS